MKRSFIMFPLLVYAKISYRSFLATIICLGVLLLASHTNPALAASTLHVKPTATGSGDCSTWANACTLQAALGAAASGDEIWVAAGTYTPHASDRTVSFALKTGVAVYGGFAGTETALDQRDIAANPTILSGDLAGDDQTGGSNIENAYHVVVGDGTGDTAVLDGFTISGGNASGLSYPNNGGGGMYNFNFSSPTLTNVTFAGNAARTGGGMNNDGSSPVLTNVIFSDNSAFDYGGGMDNVGNSSPTLTEVTFSGNTASLSGGGMRNFSGSSPALTNVTFSGNTAASFGGGMYNNSSSSPTLTDVTFSSNSANYGGGMFNYASSSPTLTNVTFSGNSASVSGGGMDNEANSSPTLTNVIIANSTSGGDCVNVGSGTLNGGSGYNLIEDVANACGLTNGVNGNIIGSDPNLGPLSDNGGATRTHALLTGSPAINAGTTSGCPASDQRGITRPVGASCDIGAFELYTGVYYVKTAATGNMDCQSWAGACTLQFALKAAAAGDEVWVAAGSYTPHASDRAVSFILKTGVGVYGGFAGTETLRSQRDVAANPTILSGDLAGDDNANVDPNEPTRAENAYHVVVGSGTDATAVLDGFTISGGNANGTSDPDYHGGGMLNQTGSPTLTDVTFSGNSASHGGGGLRNEASSPTLENVTFSGNSASGGGGMNNDGSSPTLTDVTFSGNLALGGGGMYNFDSSPMLTNVTFSGNVAAYRGGGMLNYASIPTLTNVAFSDNSANTEGGGIYNTINSSPALVNVIIANSSSGGDCVNDGTSTLDPASSHNLIKDGANACGLANGANGNIIGSDPILGPLADNGGATQTHALLAGSPAIDAGTNSGCPATDQRGVTRPQGSVCDIGAYEASASEAQTQLFLPLIQR
jgi:predicted outer membrane repeat protein